MEDIMAAFPYDVKCPRCGEGFFPVDEEIDEIDELDYTNHLLEHLLDSAPLPFSCNICGQVLSHMSNEEVAKHIDSHRTVETKK